MELYYEIDAQTPESYEGDAVRLRQILMNLINNAIKFTDEGEVVVYVSSKEISDNRQLLHIAVRDTGIGIGKEKIESLFNPFSQADLSTTRRFGGTGLGLAICQKLVHLMQGKIWIESEPGQGSTFHFEIPLDEADIQDIEPAKEEKVDLNANHSLPKLKILVVEDNIINQQLAIRLLRHLGLQADVVGDGKQALIAVSKNHYDVVFMDVQMPIMDGLEATREIIRLHGDKRPRIIAMTANVFAEDKKKCFDAGMDDFVGKPLEGNVLVQALRKSTVRDDEPVVPQQLDVNNTVDDSSILDLSVVNRRFKGMFDIYVKMARLFIKQAPTIMENIYSAVENADGQELKAAAHELKGVLGNLCAQSLADKAHEIEQLALDAQYALAEKQAKTLEKDISQMVGILQKMLDEQQS